jgi:hypothetical protein
MVQQDLQIVALHRSPEILADDATTGEATAAPESASDFSASN